MHVNPAHFCGDVRDNSASGYPEKGPDASLSEFPVLFTKSVDRSAALPGDVIQVSLTLKNPSAQALLSTEVSDSLPEGLALVNGSIRPIPGPNETLEQGISLGRLAAGQSVTLIYEAKVLENACASARSSAIVDYTYLDGPGEIVRSILTSNDAEIQIPGVIPVFEKTVNPTSARVGDVVRYTLTLKNPSSVLLQSVVVADPGLNSKLRIRGICLNGRPLPDCVNLEEGILVGSLEPRTGRAVITFDGEILCGGYETLSNTACASYRYLFNGREENGEKHSNTATLWVVHPQLAVKKFAEKPVVGTGKQEIVYHVTVSNQGDIPIRHIVVTDVFPNGFSYVEGSTRIGEREPIDLHPGGGIPVGALYPGQSVTLEFCVTICF